MILSQKEQSSFRLTGCQHLAKASDCWGRRGDSGGGQQQRTWAGVLSLQPHVEVWHVQRQHAQRSGSRTWSSSHRSGRGEVETLQLDRGGSDAARRGGVDVERATCPPTRMFFLCQDVLSPCAIIPDLSWLQRTRPEVLPCRPRALREAARLNRVRITSAHGHLEALQCYGVDVVGRVSSLPGNLHVLGVNKGQKVFCHLRLGLGERHRRHQCRVIFFEKEKFFLKVWKQITFFRFPREPPFSHASKIALRDWKLSWAHCLVRWRCWAS